MITLLSTIFGALTAVLPQLVEMFDRKNRLEHEREVLRLRMDAAAQGVELQISLENSRADAREGESLRTHDMALGGNSFIETLRASVRPVITYLFFFLFIFIKGTALAIMVANGLDITKALVVIWDAETVAIFGAIMGFWFGARVMEKIRSSYEIPEYLNNVTTLTNSERVSTSRPVMRTGSTTIRKEN
jgi:hypothetical protein